MAEPIDMDEHRRAKSAGAAPGRILKNGDGDGTSGGMEARIAKLEAHMEHVRDDLGKLASVPADIAGMKSDVSNLPTKDYLGQQFDKQFRWMTGIVIIIVGIAGLIVKFT